MSRIQSTSLVCQRTTIRAVSLNKRSTHPDIPVFYPMSNTVYGQQTHRTSIHVLDNDSLLGISYFSLLAGCFRRRRGQRQSYLRGREMGTRTLVVSYKFTEGGLTLSHQHPTRVFDFSARMACPWQTC